MKKIGRGVIELIFNKGPIKYDIHKVPMSRSLLEIKILRQDPYTKEGSHSCLIKGTYGITSGLFYPSSIRYFSTNSTIFNWKGSDDFPILQWIQKEMQKKYQQNYNENNKTNDTLNAVVKEIFKPKPSSVSNNPNLKNGLNAFDNKTIRIDAKITITTKKDYHSFTSQGKRYFSLHNSLILTKPNGTSLILYKAPETRVSLFIKEYHDWKWPDFTHYRLSRCKDPEWKANRSEALRKLPTHIMYTLYGLGLAYGCKAHGLHYVYYMAASAEVLALAKIEVNLSEIPEGRMMTYKWRGKPLFIRHRTQEMIQRERSVDISTLRDPETDEARVQDPKWLVVLGICTHLGCVPIPDQGDYPGGYYCPCHGSHFDGSGRTRKGPAPTNMEVPAYKFLDANTVVIG